MLIHFPMQQWLHERASMLRYTCTPLQAALFSINARTFIILAPSCARVFFNCGVGNLCFGVTMTTSQGTEMFDKEICSIL
jgi:hypothetical protein